MGSAAGHHSIHSYATEDGKVLSSESESSHNEGDGAEEDDNAKEDKGGIETSSDGQVASDGKEGQECPHTQDTLTGISQVFGEHEDTDPESEPGEKIQFIQQKQCPESPKEDSSLKDSSRSSSSEEELQTNEALHNEAWQKAQLLDTRFDTWHCDKIAKEVTGWVTRDSMICDLPKHGKMQPNHPDPMGPPLDYMGECQVFNGIWSDIYDLCRFYALGMTRVPHTPGTSYPWPGQGPVKVSLHHRLTMTLPDPGTQCRFGNGCLYVEGTAHGHLFMTLTSGPLGQVYKTIILPLLHIHGREQSFLSQPYHNSALQHQLWMWKVLEAGLHVILCPAQPQESVPQVCHQETSHRF